MPRLARTTGLSGSTRIASRSVVGAARDAAPPAGTSPARDAHRRRASARRLPREESASPRRQRSRLEEHVAETQIGLRIVRIVGKDLPQRVLERWTAELARGYLRQPRRNRAPILGIRTRAGRRTAARRSVPERLQPRRAPRDPRRPVARRSARSEYRATRSRSSATARRPADDDRLRSSPGSLGCVVELRSRRLDVLDGTALESSAAGSIRSRAGERTIQRRDRGSVALRQSSRTTDRSRRCRSP